MKKYYLVDHDELNVDIATVNDEEFQILAKYMGDIYTEEEFRLEFNENAGCMGNYTLRILK